MRIGSLFSGIGGLELGLEWAGVGHTVWQVEKEPFCREILAKHWPEVKRYDDIRTVGSSVLEPVDLICGGFPCQDISAAGNGAGLAGSRSGLWFEYARIVAELRPQWVVIENVGSGAKRWVDQVCAHLGELGYEAFPFPISAQAVGAPHRRNRIFIVAYAVSARREVTGPERFDKEERTSTGRIDVQGGGKAEPRHDGSTGLVTNTGSERRSSGGQPSDGEQQSAPGCVTNRRGSTRSEARRDKAPPAECWTPIPPVRGVDAGSSTKLDRARLKALGNMVVPQCAEVVGWIIRELVSINSRS